MKILSTLIIIFGIAYLAIPSFAQEQQEMERVVYCDAVAYGKLFSTKVRMEVDFGDPWNPYSSNYILDESGKPKEFYSVVDGLNYLAQEGWEFVQVYVVPIGETYTTHYVLRKKIE